MTFISIRIQNIQRFTYIHGFKGEGPYPNTNPCKATAKRCLLVATGMKSTQIKKYQLF